MWEDIASSIKKLDPDHADVLLEAATPLQALATPTTLPPVSTVYYSGSTATSGGNGYNANFSGMNFELYRQKLVRLID